VVELLTLMVAGAQLVTVVAQVVGLLVCLCLCLLVCLTVAMWRR
jgi:hypothetical protein